MVIKATYNSNYEILPLKSCNELHLISCNINKRDNCDLFSIYHKIIYLTQLLTFNHKYNNRLQDDKIAIMHQY